MRFRQNEFSQQHYVSLNQAAVVRVGEGVTVTRKNLRILSRAFWSFHFSLNQLTNTTEHHSVEQFSYPD